MASRDLNDLIPEVAEQARRVVANCAQQGVTILIYCTARTLEEQAILYRQSRDFPVIHRKITQLQESGYDFAARILYDIGPQGPGPHVTNAAPAETWHNYKEAFDSVPLVCGKPLWDVRSVSHDIYPQWAIYGQEVRKAGMTWFGKLAWDWGHAHMREVHNPLKLFGPDEAQAILKERRMLV